MTTFDQELTGRYVAAGGDRSDLDARRVPRAVFVRGTIRTLYNADKKFGLDPADNGSLAELIDATEWHLEHVSNGHQTLVSGDAANQQRTDPMRKHHSALGGVALALALTLTGCSDDGTDPNAEDAPTATPSMPTTSASPTPKKPEERVTTQLSKYLDVRDDFYRAAKIDFKRLNKVATGDEFLQIQAAIVDLDRYNIKATGEYVHTLGKPRRRSDSMFIITDCQDRSGVVERGKDGKRIKHTDPNGAPLRNPVPVEYTLVRDKGAWKVSDSDVRWDQPC